MGYVFRYDGNERSFNAHLDGMVGKGGGNAVVRDSAEWR